MVTISELFDALDADRDGRLSRDDLRTGATQLGWSWREGPLLGVLDLLTLPGPASRGDFFDTVERVISDPAGPFGEVLLKVTRRAWAAARRAGTLRAAQTMARQPSDSLCGGRLGDTVGEEAATVYRGLTFIAESYPVPVDAAVLLVIDPQRSFTEGAWMRSLGHGAEVDVQPLRRAFSSLAGRLQRLGGEVEVMLTRCPFPADSYDWALPIGDVLQEAQPYFIKPGNSVLWPHTNGFAEALEDLPSRAIQYLVIGGCTLNSCVRVSSVQVQKRFGPKGLQVVVDLEGCGARARNYAPSSLFEGRAPVAAALQEMHRNGVIVAQAVDWGRRKE
jgi:hypothetical protein